MYNFSPRANDLLAQTQLFAKKYKHAEINTLHLLLASFNMGDSVLSELVALEQGGDVDKIVGRLHYTLEHLKLKQLSKDKQHDLKMPADHEVKRILELSKEISHKMDHSFIGTEHLMLAMICHTECRAFTFLYENNVDIPGLAQSLREYLDPSQVTDDPVETNATGGADSMMKPGEALEMFAIDMTALAKNGELDPVIGRESEIERLMQVLCRRQKNNPVLVGEPGVGKTAVVEGLCNLIASDEAPMQLKDRKIYNLDLSLMVAGTKFRGQFEERMKQVIDDLTQLKNVVVFIDEIHMLVGAGNADGAMDAANILKPALSRGGLSCIGTTTFDEYREFIESDGALERRFQKIVIDEPDADVTVEILKGLKSKYEEFHSVFYTEQAVETAVDLSGRYITDRFYPDKAIDILDECAARERLKKGNTPKRLKLLESKINDCTELMNDYLLTDDYVSAATYRAAEKRLNKKKRNMINRALDKQKSLTITEHDIRTTVSSWCGVPLDHLKKSECKKLINLERDLNKHVMGQQQAVQTICDSVIRGRTDVGDPDRPVGSFLLMGPTGVGKTYLAKQLAKYVFGDQENMIRVDMSELMEAHSVSKLIGSPPGYVGYGEGGQLTEQVRYNPYSVVLFDEIEKAHPDVMQLLLQLLDEGQLTDSRGVTINFRNCIVLMTSNVGADRMQKNHVVGFGATDEDNMEQVKKQLREFLRPEFLNRLDEIVMFNNLSKEICNKILSVELKKFTSRLARKDVKVRVTNTLRKMLLDTGFDKKYGARPLRRVIQSKIQTPVAKFLLSNEGPVDIVAGVKNDQIVIEQKETPVG
jgi:ATP-dependent Clp protease ATP-binding subunit ClpC